MGTYVWYTLRREEKKRTFFEPFLRLGNLGLTLLGDDDYGSYATNGNLDLTLTKSFCYKYRVKTNELSKGRATFSVPGFQNKVQFTTNGVFMIFGGIGRDDEAILTALKEDVVTVDGHPFTWTRTTKVLGARELQAQVSRLSRVMSDYVTKFHA